MKKTLFLIMLLLGGIYLVAQPAIDTVRPGIKSIKKMICGYSYNDSTGLVVQTLKEYNAKGQITRRIQQINSERLGIKDFDEEPEAEAYFYSYWNEEPHIYDTMKYHYNAKFQQVKWTSRDYEKKLQQGVIAYDEHGNFISEVSSINGVEEVFYEWRYDTNGRLVSKWYRTRALPAKKVEERRYDGEGRIVAKISYNDYGDSTVYNYAANGKQELSYQKSGSFKRIVYDLNDSLVSSAYYFKRTNYKSGESQFDLFDSIHIARTPAGIKTARYKITYYSSATEIQTDQYDEKGRCVLSLVTVNGEDFRKITYTYNDSLRTTTYKRYGIYHDKSNPDLYGKEALKEERIYIYNAKNQLVEERRMNGKRKLLERTVYQYKYY
jgi:hypothetical protein